VETESKIPEQEPLAAKDGITGFAKQVLRYFQDFIQTDFKRQQAPRRRIVFKSDSGFRMGVPLRKYPALYEALIKKIQAPISKGFEFSIPKGRYTSPLSPTLRDLIRQQVQAIPDEAFEAIRASTLSYAESKRFDGSKHAEKYVDDVSVKFVEEAGQRIVLLLLSLLEEPFKQCSYSAVESVYDIEADLSDTITIPAIKQFPTALNTLITTGDNKAFIAVLDEFFSPLDVRQSVMIFFDEFATADVFLELRDLENTLSTTENQALYLYLGDIRFGTASFPMFYIPLEVEFEGGGAAFNLRADPHLYVNKRALDWIAQEISAQNGRTFISPALDRILYLDETDSFSEAAQRLTQGMVKAIDLASEIDFTAAQMKKVSNSTLQMSTSMYLAVFDRSDESILSDYEALLTAVEQDNLMAQQMFTNIVRGMILEEPHNSIPAIEAEWDGVLTPDRLIFASPIPMNEEQRKIQIALKTPDCNYIIVQGPPGTGKSHTISAIAFDSILNGQNILILSDKNEALDVVEDKLAQTLEKVRHAGGDFPNPILRLGKTNSYPKLMATATLERIKEQDRAQKANAAHLDAETKETHADLRSKVEQTISAYTSVNLKDVEELHHLEAQIEKAAKGITLKIRQQKESLPHFQKITASLETLSQDNIKEYMNFLGDDWRSATVLLEEVCIASSAHHMIAKGHRHSCLALFPSIHSGEIPVLSQFINEYEQAKWPIFGYFFVKGKANAITQRLIQKLECSNNLDLHLRVNELRKIVSVLEALKQSAIQHKVKREHENLVYQHLISGANPPDGFTHLGEIVAAYQKAMPEGWPSKEQMGSLIQILDLVRMIAKYAIQWERISNTLASAPSFDYVNDKTRLETLHASRMSREIDHKFIRFVENNKALARSLGAVIKAKKQFPTDEFDRFSQAFPCIIAGIREYAQYVPLKHQSFDVVVIDEASQVSIAQALPALLRAKRVVVFGDEKQFSNVKSQQASKERNATYTTELETFFRRKVSDSADRIQRLKQFDVKKSVLDFFKLIANAEIMLKKHFRGYQELISFSSVNFYEGRLQAIKIRSKPITDVIRFEVLNHDGRTEKKRNSNTVEAEFILAELKKLLAMDSPPTVGVITPFTEQQVYLSHFLKNDSDGDRFERELRLKVMTFDTCQGEERELIIYSLVATKDHDVLNYVFPASLEEDKDRIEEALKVQRLNVGFSRAQEGMLFVLSKPIDAFRGSIGKALRHYENVLTRRADLKDAVVESPMEAKVLDWVQKTAFYQSNIEQLELMPQFPVGDYLKQLDPNYHHPAFRADFLLTYYGEDRQVRVIIEYDGFAEHFVNREKVTSANFDQFYKASDIERQFIIESYGYKFLRLNRFNMGDDPITTLSERLYQLVDDISKKKPLKSLDQIMAHTEGLANGDSKVCSRCEDILPLADFFDPELAKGAGAYGRVCMSCKSESKTVIRPKSVLTGRARKRYWGQRY
jgi:hypothetical protein